MKKIILPLLSFVLCISAYSQKIGRINFSATGELESIGLDMDENVLLNLNKDGSIGKFGVDIYKGYRDNYNNQLQDYNGRIEYFTDNDNEAFRGKVKSIGRYQITYYASFDKEELVGKVKSIGTLNFDYYPSTENEAYRGNLKSVGSAVFTYYSSYDNDGFRGKIKSVGGTNITYFSSLEDAGYKGKIKSIGSYSYTYYPGTYFRAELRGRVKTGNLTQTDNGIKYFIKF